MKRNMFTFVELLVVITVILILIGISVPIYAIVKQKARITQAKAQISQLRIAITGYESTYQYLPLTPQYDTDKILEDDDYNTMLVSFSGGNPRGIKYLETPGTTSTFADPWGKSFKVAMDFDYSGFIHGDNSGTPVRLVPGGDVEFANTVAIWSLGPDGAYDTDPNHESNDDNVTSWDVN